ncbi:MAG: ABC transporter permease subunit [Desulfobacterales bacterium]|nr:ABC transporter permease subunit [Desulfobacterales bacterium]
MDFTLLEWGAGGWGDEMLRAAFITFAVSLAAFGLGILLGIGGAALKLSRYIILRFIADIYTTIVRGIPELLIIYLVFFGGGILLSKINGLLFGTQGFVNLPLFVTGMICIGFSSGAYSAEVIRGAVLAVPKGQIEAAKAVGMGPFILFIRILVPQVTRLALPGMGNIWQLTLKHTALISVIGLVEIMRQSAVAAGSTREPFTFYTVAGLLYLALTAVSGRAFARAEHWAAKGVRQ